MWRAHCVFYKCHVFAICHIKQLRYVIIPVITSLNLQSFYIMTYSKCGVLINPHYAFPITLANEFRLLIKQSKICINELLRHICCEGCNHLGVIVMIRRRLMVIRIFCFFFNYLSYKYSLLMNIIISSYDFERKGL